MTSLLQLFAGSTWRVRLFRVGVGLALLGSPMTALAQPSNTRMVTLDTSPLVGHAAGPFSLAFSLTDGGGAGNANNTVTITGFQFGWGSASGVPVRVGGATGSLTSGITLTDSAFDNLLVEPFVPGDRLTFTVSVTGNLESGGIPDRFSLSILDRTGAEIPTLGGENLDAVVATVIDAPNPPLEMFGSDPIRTPVAGGAGVSFALFATPSTAGNSPKSIPADGATDQSSTPTLCCWPGVLYPSEYCIDTINNNACDTGWVPTRANSATLRGLTPSTTYYWQVRFTADPGASQYYGDGSPTAYWSFTTLPASDSPSGLFVSSILGNLVTFRWTPATIGPSATGYVLEGGLRPGDVLASIATGSPAPVFTVPAPTGSYYVRVHALNGGVKGPASNEILVHVNVPVAPSAPANLLGLVNGSTLGLAWTNTYAGGTPTSLVLEVTGSVVASLPLGVADSFSFVGVPGGTYTMALRAQGVGGTSQPSNPVTLTFPGPCSGPPQAATDFLAFKSGGVLYLYWSPPVSGAAPSGYLLNVTGSFVGTFPMAGRSLSGVAPPGTFNFAIVATNACGTSGPTPTQTVSFP